MRDSRSETPSDHRVYRTVLKSLANARPVTADYLANAERERTERLKHLEKGVRLRGFEELVTHLEKLAAVYERNRRLRSVAFLLYRARADFFTALEAALSGYHFVAYDAMRDVMEIEFLLRDFCLDPAHIDEWRTADDRNRYRNFRPVVLRQRYATSLGVHVEDLADATDYKGHSLWLHVNPYPMPFGGPGLVHGPGFSADSCFWEIFEHARRLLMEAHRLRRRVAPHLKSPYGPKRGLRHVKRAWEATQQMFTVFRALVDAIHRNGDDTT